jgi:addiction module HigA family antidote
MSKYKAIDKNEKEIFSSVLLHPGEVLELELSARNMKKSQFAESLGIKPGHLSELLHGRRYVSAITALNLEKLPGIEAEYWLRMQIDYDLQIERNKLRQAA